MVTRRIRLRSLLLICGRFNGKLMLVLEASETSGKGILKVYGGHLLPAVEKIDVVINK